MGITIHFKLAQKKKYVKSMLDRTEKIAYAIKAEQANKLGIEFAIKRASDYSLFINMAGCETLVFDFKSYKDTIGEAVWREKYLEHLFKDYKEPKCLIVSNFCKTQYAEKVVEHKWVADLIASVARYCPIAEVYDEGDYYHSGVLDDATDSIEKNGKMINVLGNMLGAMKGEGVEIIKSGETKIKNDKRIHKS